MDIRPRLFARCLEPDEDLKKPSLEPIIIVLSDLLLDDERLQHKLKDLPNCKILYQSNPEDCLKLLNEDKNENYSIYVIASDLFANSSRQFLHDISTQIKCVYLVDRISCAKQLLWNTRFFLNINDPFLHTNLRDGTRDLRHPEYTSDGTDYVQDNEIAKYVWYRFFFNVLDRLEHTNIARREVMSKVRDLYGKNPYLSDQIDEFEKSYHSDQSVFWFTRESFLYRVVNEALRSGDINNMFPLRVIIRDLDRNLRMLHSQQVYVKLPCLYRGQQLHIDDIIRQKANVGKCISMNTFLSTTSDLYLAKKYSQTTDFINNSSLVSVIQRITNKIERNKVIVASIEHISEYAQEKEWLFSFRSLFRINQVEKVNGVYYIDLTAMDEDDQEFSAGLDPWKEAIGEQSFFSAHQQPLFFRNMNSENEPFLAFQLFIDIILRLDQTEFAREEMIEMCRQKYANSLSDLKKIDEFEQNYRHEDAIKWYTTNTFLYRLLHRSLRTENIDTIFKLRYYIYDLHNQLVKLHTSYIRSLPKDQPILTLYRGQKMELIDLEKLQNNVGNLISMNSFLSTTNDCVAAVFFSGLGSLDDSTTEVPVLYQITIDIRSPHSVPFAKIQYESIFKDEDEVLFSMASVFRVDAVEPYGGLWIVDLTLVNKEDEQWNILTAHLNRRKI